MPHPYSSDLRLRVAKAVDAGKTTREVAEQFQVSPSFAFTMHRLWKTSGSVPCKQIGGYRVSRLEAHRAALQEYLTANPSATLAEIRTWLIETHQETLSISAIDKFIRHHLGYRYKKNGQRQ
ncbi:MAG: helix-turn-helix domain-containing protein [Methylobacter sp.]